MWPASKRPERLSRNPTTIPFQGTCLRTGPKRVLRRDARQADVNCHDLREVHSIGAGYQVIWTREERARDANHCSHEECSRSRGRRGRWHFQDRRQSARLFRRACSDSSPLLPPVELRLPENIRMMTFRTWARMLRDEKLVTLLAHCYCSPPGPIKTFLESLIGKWRKTEPAKVAFAEEQLLSFLAASARFGTWKWNPMSGLVKGKPYRQRELIGGYKAGRPYARTEWHHWR